MLLKYWVSYQLRGARTEVLTPQRMETSWISWLPT